MTDLKVNGGEPRNVAGNRLPGEPFLHRISVFGALARTDLHKELSAPYERPGRPSIDPRTMLLVLIIG